MDAAGSTADMRRVLETKGRCLRSATEEVLPQLGRRSGTDDLEAIVEGFRTNGGESTPLCRVLYAGPDSLDTEHLALDADCPAQREESLAKLVSTHVFAYASERDGMPTATPEEVRERIGVVFERTAANDIRRDREAFRRELTASVEGALAASNALCRVLPQRAGNPPAACPAHAAALLLHELDRIGPGIH